MYSWQWELFVGVRFLSGSVYGRHVGNGQTVGSGVGFGSINVGAGCAPSSTPRVDGRYTWYSGRGVGVRDGSGVTGVGVGATCASNTHQILPGVPRWSTVWTTSSSSRVRAYANSVSLATSA